MAQELAGSEESSHRLISPRETFDFWKVMAISSTACAVINLGLLYFLTVEIGTLILSDSFVINTHPARASGLPAASDSASPRVD